ncbi:hypothetical protein [Kutzneria sp. NPDC052558]|uniref:hypothetical protein n=1 Tax=Kutzneria sp. NPDC052558 TaxID=3364121 RepID=UPI0037CA796A
MRQESMLNINSPNRAVDDDCARVFGKIDFLLKVQEIADGVDQIEPLLEDLVDSILRASNCKVRVEFKFQTLVRDLNVMSLEILQYCMYKLRWQSIRDMAEDLLMKEAGINRRRLLERLVESFGDDWPERELYRRYDGD